eukprot:TRINITY_DN2667_c0_g1_i1.p1 TRINITY_DN2667_c0_g1~~TRINITY_DN2667_c0_g1_i1.p1  ORF type:complete len:561 (-),score=93.04 TRINITY_DN2667_c0_g1_i1:1-1683(-)
MATVAPLCSWFVAACVSRTVLGAADEDLGAILNTPRRRQRRRYAPRKQFTKGFSFCKSYSESGAFVVVCQSSFRNLGSCLSFEASSESNGFTRCYPFSRSFPGSEVFKTGRRQRKTTVSGRVLPSVIEPVQKTSGQGKAVTEERRVVVTGMGVMSSLGDDPHIFYEKLLEGQSGISQIESFDCSDFPTRIAGEIKSFSTDGWVSPKFSKRMDKFMLYLLIAGKKAIADAGMTEDVLKELDKERCGVLIGSALGGMKVFNDGLEALNISHRKMNPFCVPFATTNMGSAMLAIDLGWMGPTYSISTACATSNSCILSALNHIKCGEADLMLTGGSDAAIIPIGVGGFIACRALSQRNNEPAKASRPWDIDRDGFVMGEGAGALLLEELEHAKKRGAKIYAEILGGSSTSDAYHMTEPHPEGEGIFLCIENALSAARVRREDINYVNAHATSTKAGDMQEYKALIRCFGQNPELKVNATKSMTGHLLGAAGAVEAIATVQAIQTGWIHPTINLDDPDKDVDMNIVVGEKKQRLNIKVALSNSFGFGGHNCSILFCPYRESKGN